MILIPPFCTDLHRQLACISQDTLLETSFFMMSTLTYLETDMLKHQQQEEQQAKLGHSLFHAKSRLISNLQMLYRSLTERDLMRDLDQLHTPEPPKFMYSNLFLTWFTLSVSILPHSIQLEAGRVLLTLYPSSAPFTFIQIKQALETTSNQFEVFFSEILNQE